MTQKYQVLARKYRPQRFQEVVGQETIVTTLKNALRFAKIAHAYLFCGSRGTGKTTLARLFAKALNCQQPGNDQEPCNSCSSCADIMAGQSLDVIEIDGASNRGIDDIRQINETVGYAPTHGRYKIYIIDEVHMLTKEAFNALLKTLEEPPERAKFFFATTEPHKILPTIISRCQRFDLGRILPSQIIAKLAQIATDLSRTVEPDALHQIAELSEGSLRDAESLLDQILCFVEGTVHADAVRQVFGLISEEHFFALDKAFSECRPAFAFELVGHLFQAGKDLSHFMSQLIDHYRLIAIAKTLGSEAIPSPLADRYMQSARAYTQSQSLYILEYLLNAEAGLQKSLSGRVYLESVLLHVIRSKNRIPVEVLVRRLSEMESALANQAPLPAPRPELTMPKEAIDLPPIQPATLPKEAIETPRPKPTEEPSKPATLSKEAIETPRLKPVEEPVRPAAIPQEPVELPQPKPAVKTIQPEATPMAAEAAAVPKTQSTEKPKKEAVEKRENIPAQHPSRYDTLMRFAAVELEGSLKIT